MAQPQKAQATPDFIPYHPDGDVPDFIPLNANSHTPIVPPKVTVPGEGLMHSLGSSLGLTDQSSPLDDIKQHPIESAIDAIGGPAVPALRGAFQGAKRSAGELIDAGRDALNGNSAGAAYHGIKSIPMIGPGMDKAASQYADKDYLGEAGTLLGTAAQAAPAVLGGIDAVAPQRGLLGQIPSSSRAISKFQSLDNDLANQPVPLKSALQPLQRATELGARGGTLPKAASDLLTRSQSPIDMTYPEIRDYQSNLSDLSRDAQGSMNRKMLGQIGRLNKGLYGDIFDAASSAGRGEDYAQAMKEFRQAAQLKDLAKKTVKAGAKYALPAGGVGALAYRYLK